MSYNSITVENRSNPKGATMSILTVIEGANSSSQLVNDHGNVIAQLDGRTRQTLLQQGVEEKVIRK